MKLAIVLLHISVISLHAEPLLTCWDTGISSRYARLYATDEDELTGTAVSTWNRGQGVQAMPTYAGVHEVAVTETDIYIRATGLGGHIMGPWYGNEQRTNLFGNYPANQALLYRIPRTPGVPPATKSLTGLGRIGVFVDGVSMFDSRDAFSYDTSAGQDQMPRSGLEVDGDDVWNRDAYINEGVTFDRANAHQAGSHYHYHANPAGLRHLLGDNVDYDPDTNTYTENFGGTHSPILGWVRDGYPIYGPYGYSNPDDAGSPVTRMRSGYQVRSITERHTLPAHASRDQGYTEAGDTSEFPVPDGSDGTRDLRGPDVTSGAGSQYQIGHYIEDYEYLGDVGYSTGIDFDLDLHNGRYCVTPEFPDGTYAYFVSIEPDGTPKFPYNIGRTYFGMPDAGPAGAMPEDAVTVFEGGPEKSITGGEIFADESSGDVTLAWSAVEGGTYIVQRTSDLANWETIGATQEDDLLVATDASALNERKQQFYRTDLVGVAPFDANGFDVDLDLGPDGGNSILLLIVDDWGVDWSPVDNPGAAQLPEMPHLQSLADRGVRFTHAYAQPTCSPTRATLLTGRHPFRHGVGSPAGANVPDTETTLPEAFAVARPDYSLVSIGKWHLGGGVDGARSLGGWPTFSGAPGNVDDYWTWDKTVDGNTAPVSETYATTDQVDDALSFIHSRPPGSPWFCWIGFNAPHAPFHDPPGELLPAGAAPPANNRERYEQMLEALDHEIGRLLDEVDIDSTNIILVGDNGTPNGLVQDPFSGGHGKGSLYEGGIRVPLVAAGPDILARGTNDSLVHVVDLYATVLSLAGIDIDEAVPAGTVVDSRDLYPALLGGTVEGDVVSETFGNQIENPGRSIRRGDFKLIVFDNPETTADSARYELYNVSVDPDEQTELLSRNTELSPEERAAYDALLARNIALGGGFGDPGGGGGTGTPVSTGILSLSPLSAPAGVTLTVTFNFDESWQPTVPPLNNMEGNPITPTVTLGGITGTAVNRLSRHVLQATFTLPSNPGSLEATAEFPGPNRPAFGLTSSFQVTP